MYAGVPLATLNPKRRGEALASLVRTVLADQREHVHFRSAERSLCMDGRLRGQHQTEYDWLCGGRRIECKSSQLRWCDKAKKGWFRFDKVKLASNIRQWPQGVFDDLVLALYSPKSVHVYQHDLSLGVHSVGKQTSILGYGISISSFSGKPSWSTAVDEILGKLDAPTNSCKRLAEIALDDDRVKIVHENHSSPISEQAYKDIPLSDMTPQRRGLLLQSLVAEIDSMINPGALINQPDIGRCVNGSRRSAATAEYDWLRNGLRVECKSAALMWDKSGAKWRLTFGHVKMNAFDDLLLAIYSPRGVYVYRYDGSFALSTSGVETAINGYTISVAASAHVYCWSAALEMVLKQFEAHGCQLLAVVYWD